MTALARILAQLPDAHDRALVLSWAPPSLRRALRAAERDAALLQLAMLYPLPSGRQIAAAMRADLQRIAGRGWRECAPGHMLALETVLSLSGGSVPSLTAIRAALAGLGGQDIGRDSGHGARDDDTRPGVGPT